ncbi:MAG: Ppx/GppA phosphatase family protein [Mariprofundales bacterium]
MTMGHAHPPMAAIDIGSNTIRMIIATPAAGTPPWQMLHYHHHIARLGEGVRQSGQLGQAGIARTLAALEDLTARCRHWQVAPENIFATATAAVRQAENGQQFCCQVKQVTGLQVRILSGEEEAALTLKGAKTVLESDVLASMLLFDIGGGSTEFTTVKDGAITSAISQPLGVIRLVEEGLRSDPPSADDWQIMRQLADDAVQRTEQSWPPSHQIPQHLVGTAGTVTTLAAVAMEMEIYDADVVNRYQLDRSHFKRLMDTLCALNHDTRQAIPAIEAGRADLIIGGLAIIDAIFERWHHPTLRTVDSGLMEGVLAEAIGKSIETN